MSPYPYFDARVMIGDARYHVTQGRDVILKEVVDVIPELKIRK